MDLIQATKSHCQHGSIEEATNHQCMCSILVFHLGALRDRNRSAGGLESMVYQGIHTNMLSVLVGWSSLVSI